jgi:predicted nucleic acid-binding protein
MEQCVTIFLDACIIIYWVEAADPFYSRVAQAVISLKKENPKTNFAVSRLTLLECMVKPLRESNNQLIKRYEQFLNAPDLSIIEITPQIITRATSIRAFEKLKTPDSIQAASALSISGEVVFVTADQGFERVAKLKIHII